MQKNPTVMNPFPKPTYTEVTFSDGMGVSHTMASNVALQYLFDKLSERFPRHSWDQSQKDVEVFYKNDTEKYYASVREWFGELGIKFVDSSTRDWESPWFQVETPEGVFNVEDLIQH